MIENKKLFLLLLIFILLTQTISAEPLHFSKTEAGAGDRYVLTDRRGSPTYVAGIVYDPVECEHTEMVDIDNDLKRISDAHFNVVRLKTDNNLEITEKVLDTAEKYYPDLMFIVSFLPYQYSTEIQTGMDF